MSTNTASIATNTNTVKTAGDNISDIQSKIATFITSNTAIQNTLKASITTLTNEINTLKSTPVAPVTLPKGAPASDVALA